MVAAMTDLPWFKRKRCQTGDGDPQNMECMVCGAAFGEACRARSVENSHSKPKEGD